VSGRSNRFVASFKPRLQPQPAAVSNTLRVREMPIGAAPSAIDAIRCKSRWGWSPSVVRQMLARFARHAIVVATASNPRGARAAVEVEGVA
jgi:hypothetical protein